MSEKTPANDGSFGAPTDRDGAAVSRTEVSAQRAPAYMWYPGDHRRDIALQTCSYEAQAFWRFILDVMHWGEPYGHLATAGGVAITPADLARMTGVSLRRVKRWMAELETRSVFSRTATGIVYSRRMVRDERTRRKRAAGGHKSLEHPRVPRAKRRGGSGGTETAPSERSASSADEPDVASTSACPGSESFAPGSDAADASFVETSEALFARLGEPAATVTRDFLGAVPAGTPRTRWIAEIASWLEGLNLALTATPDDIRVGLSDYLLQPDRDYAAVHVRAFIGRATRDRNKAELLAVPKARQPSEPSGNDAASGDAERAFSAVCRLKRWNGVQDVIPLDAVKKLGPVAVRAYLDVGGCDRFRATAPDKLGYLRREFVTAYRAATQTTPADGFQDADG